jgi:hypothetical protein
MRSASQSDPVEDTKRNHAAQAHERLLVRGEKCGSGYAVSGSWHIRIWWKNWSIPPAWLALSIITK